MADRTDWESLANVLAGESGEKDDEKVEAWLKAEGENKQTFELLQKAMATGETLPRETDVEALWQGVAERTGLAEQDAEGEVEQIEKQDLPVKRAPFLRYWKYAAAILLVAALGLVLKVTTPGLFTGAGEEWHEIKIEKGKKGNITLADGTTVTLDAGSTLRYPTEFTGPTRKVFLDGEGFFKVTSDVEKKFKVFAGRAVVTVIGTRFNVRAWKETATVKVAVLEGKVALNGKDAPEAQRVLLTKGQFSVLSGNGVPAKPQTTDVNQLLGWMKRDMAFENALLPEILKQLERWYDVDMDLTNLDGAGVEERLTVHLEDAPLEDILQLIEALTDVKFKRDGRKIYLYSNSKKPLPKN